MDEFKEAWRHWRLKNTALFVIGMVVFLILTRTPAVNNFILQIGTLGYAGAFIAGCMFVSTYTALPASFVLFELAEHLNPLEIAVVAGIGSTVGDYIIFRFIRDGVMHELLPYLSRLGTPRLRRLISTPYFAWLLPVTGAIIIASPLPDELGVSLLGATRMKNSHFLLISLLLNIVGIFFIVLLASST